MAVDDGGARGAYDGVFEAVVQQPWLEVPKALQDEARQRSQQNQQGQLSRDAPHEWALHDTFHYQRGHADVFREAYRVSRHHPPQKGERLRVVDIGAGAATVAIALREALGRSKRNRVHYLAFDPNPGMRDLGEQILGHLGSDFRSAKYLESLDTVEFADRDRVLFTSSYVSHQEAVSADDVNRWTSLIERAVARSDRAVELIYTTADNIHSIEPKIPVLRRRLEQAGLKPKIETINVRVSRRFPEPDSSDGRVQWKPSSHLWKVQAERWVLRA
ncbi:MAG: hypothetical protein OXM54_17400 [Acidimicrobiaceae bacterium]|nr:hypothetical protein [Acidimicrobiaceae bacterium]